MVEINDRRDFLKNEAFLMEMCHDVINLAVNGVFLASVDGKIKEVNLSGCDMFGYTHDELLNMSITDLITIENLQQYPLSLDNLPIGDKNVRDRQLRRKDGSVFVAEIHGQKLSNGLVLGILRDKTEHTEIKKALQLAENLIRESEEKYRLLYEFAGVGIGYYTPQGMIISYNELAAKNLNSKPEDVAGKSLYEIFPKDAADSYLNRIEKAAYSKSSQRYEDEVYLPTGRKWFDSTYTGIRNFVGEVIGVQILSIDITDRKLVEGTLRESEERYRLLYQRSPMGYQSLDTDGNIIEVNQAWLDTLGYAREEVIGHWFGEFLVPEMVEAFRERFPKFKADGEVHNQFAMVHKNGQIITVAFDGKIGHDQAGNFKQTHCMLRDITDHQRLQDALRDSEERYRTVADYATDWETWIDPEGKYQYCSPSCEHITGYPPEKFIEAPEFILSLVHPDDREIVEEHFESNKTERQASTLIYRIHRNDGQVRWIEHNCRPVISKNGSFLGVRGNDRDVTNRKLAEKALYESEARYRRLTDHAPDIIFRYDLNPTKKLAYINPAVQTITGYSPEECTADPDLMLNMVHPDDRDQMNAMLQVLNVPEEGFTMRWIGKDGVTRWMESRIVPVRDEAGQLLAVEGITRDLTDRINAENTLKTSGHFLTRAQKIAKLGNWTRDLIIGRSTWSDGLYAIYGHERQENDDVLKLWWETVHPDDKPHTMDLENRFLAGESDYDTEYRIVRKDNDEVRIIHAMAELVLDDQGVPIQVVGVAQDITEHIHAENALRVSEQSLARSQKIAGMGSWNCNYEIGSFTWSDSLYHIYGRQKRENDNIHEMWLETVHPDDKQRMIDLDKKFIAGESEYDTECRIIRQDNHEVRIIHAIAEMVRDEKGTPLRSIGVAQDITERNRAEEELKESELRFRTLFEHAAVGVALLDTKTGCFIDINQKYCDFVGYTRTEMLDLAFQDVTYPQDIDENIENTKLLLAGEIREFAVEKRYVRKNGKIVWGTLTASPLWAPGETPPVYLHIAIVQDITERKQVEEALRKSEASLNQAQKIANVGNWSWHLSSDQYEGSDQFYTIYGINRDGASSVWHETVSQSVHSDDIALIEAADKIVMSGSIPKPIEYRVVWPDGSTHIVSDEVGEIILDEDGKPSIVTGIVQDITERKEAEKALRESERVLASAQKIAHLGSWDWNPQTNEVYWSDELYEIYGREKTDGPPPMDGWLDAVYPEDRDRLSCHIEDALAGKSPYDIEYRIFREDTQEERTIHAMGEVIWDKNNVPVRLFGSVQDITERKKAEYLLRESEEKFRYVFEASNVGKSITLPTGEMNENQAFREMLGYTHEELSKFKWQEITHPDDIEPIQKLLAQILSGDRESVRFEKRYLHKNGRTVCTDVSTVLRHDEHGAPLYFMTTVLDITERKGAEVALRESEERFKKLFTEAPMGISVTDSLTGKFINVNPMYAQIAGRTMEEMPAISWMEITHPDDIQKDDENMALLNAGKISGFQMEKRFLRPDGSSVWINMTVTPIEMEDKNNQWHLCMIEDISERKQMALVLQKDRNSLAQRVDERTAELSRSNTELLKALQTKDEFLANMSHELRTPLTAILGISEILEMGLRGPLTDPQTKGVLIIQESGEHLLSLINDILDFSKIEAGKLEIEPDFVVVDDICQASLSLIKGLAHRKDLTLNYSLSDPQLILWADARRLKQIVVNLLSNAVKFTPDGGKISLEVDLDRKQGRVRFVVQDNGIGISQADIGKLFQPFTQLDSKLSRQYEGSGLGLALVRRLVALHQGEVFVESEGVSGKGSRFTVWLPREDHLDEKPMTASGVDQVDLPALTKTGQLREIKFNQEFVILLAEDNAENATTLSEYLQIFGYQIIRARDGKEAVEFAGANPPDLILMDIQMPVMDGFEAMRRLRQDARFRETPIVALTALAMPGDLERCLEAGANDYLTKPVKMKDLLGKIKAIIN